MGTGDGPVGSNSGRMGEIAPSRSFERNRFFVDEPLEMAQDMMDESDTDAEDAAGQYEIIRLPNIHSYKYPHQALKNHLDEAMPEADPSIFEEKTPVAAVTKGGKIVSLYWRVLDEDKEKCDYFITTSPSEEIELSNDEKKSVTGHIQDDALKVVLAYPGLEFGFGRGDISDLPELGEDSADVTYEALPVTGLDELVRKPERGKKSIRIVEFFGQRYRLQRISRSGDAEGFIEPEDMVQGLRVYEELYMELGRALGIEEEVLQESFDSLDVIFDESFDTTTGSGGFYNRRFNQIRLNDSLFKTGSDGDLGRGIIAHETLHALQDLIPLLEDDELGETNDSILREFGAELGAQALYPNPERLAYSGLIRGMVYKTMALNDVDIKTATAMLMRAAFGDVQARKQIKPVLEQMGGDPAVENDRAMMKLHDKEEFSAFFDLQEIGYLKKHQNTIKRHFNMPRLREDALPKVEAIVESQKQFQDRMKQHGNLGEMHEDMVGAEKNALVLDAILTHSREFNRANADIRAILTTSAEVLKEMGVVDHMSNVRSAMSRGAGREISDDLRAGVREQATGYKNLMFRKAIFERIILADLGHDQVASVSVEGGQDIVLAMTSAPLVFWSDLPLTDMDNEDVQRQRYRQKLTETVSALRDAIENRDLSDETRGFLLSRVDKMWDYFKDKSYADVSDIISPQSDNDSYDLSGTRYGYLRYALDNLLE